MMGRSVNSWVALFVTAALTACLVPPGFLSGQETNSPTQEGWVKHTSRDGAMTVSFPGRPEVSIQKQESALGELELELIQYQTAKLAYSANSTTIPVDPEDYDAAVGLAGSINNMIGDNEVLARRDFEWMGLAGKEVKLKSSDGYFICVRSIIDPRVPRLFQVNVVASDRESIENEDAKRFFSSVSLAATPWKVADWQRRSLAFGAYQVEFPSEPEISRSEDPETEMAESTVEGFMFLTAATDYEQTPDEFNVAVALQNIKEGKSTAPYEFHGSRDMPLGSCEGMELRFTDTSDQLHYRQHCLIDGSIPRLYQVIVAHADAEQLDSAAAERFFKSFRLTEKDADGWCTVTANQGAVVFRFPAQPKINNQKQDSAIGELHMEILQGIVGETAFTALATTYPIPPEEFDVEAGLHGAVASVKQQGNELLEEKRIEQDGLPGVEFLVENANGFFVRARSFIDPAGPTMYQVNVAAESRDNVSDANAKKFLDSIQMKPQSSGKHP